MSGARLTAPITVLIAGEPVAKGRPRMTRRGIAYTPAATRKFEAHGRLAAQTAMDGRPPIEAPVRIELLAELPVPASWPERKRAQAITGDILPTSRPDIDNYIKSALDSINEIVVCDDSQIVEVRASKKFGIAPKMVMTIFALDATSSNRKARARQPESDPTPRASSHERDKCEAAASCRHNDQPTKG